MRKPVPILMSLFAQTVCAVAVPSVDANAATIVRNIAELNASAVASDAKSVRFDITARVTLPGIPGKRSFVAEDETGATRFGTNPSVSHLCPTNAGDIVRIVGVTSPSPSRNRKFENDSTDIKLVRRGTKPVPVPISAHDLYARKDLLRRLVSVKGIVHDAFRDEIDPSWSFVVLNCGGDVVYVTLFSDSTKSKELDALIGATVSATGVVDENGLGNRALMDRIVEIRSLSDVKIISPSKANPFDVPILSTAALPRPSMPSESCRHRATGHVVAVWNAESSILIATHEGDLLRVDLRSRPAPRYGEHVEVAGLPETDLYHVNLSRAIWRPAPDAPFAESEPMDVTANQLVSDKRDVTVKNARLHGRTVRLKGVVRGLPTVGLERGKVYLESEQSLIPVDASSCPEAFNGVTAGCLVEVSGTFVNDTENWRPNRVLPQIREVLIAVRVPCDVRVLARPPWWAPERLFVLAGALLTVLLGIFAWNMALRRKAERRGRELADEQLAHVASELKVVERTRLAVELHDSLSQTLTGISMGIDSAIDIAGDASEELKKQLAYTSKTVEACRTELRNCLWDLRSQALEESDMNTAIKLALSQIVSKTALNVRFAVPRARLSDKTTHTILRIIRELATNAVRHGHASSIKIAGCIDDGKLHFSVADNGTGFDPDHAAGVAEGHFGLEGIRERVDRLDGEVDISSSPGRGTKVTVAFDIPPAKMEEEHDNG